MACILLWMPGGPSQFETFDPKPGHANGGETKAIDTAVPVPVLSAALYSRFESRGEAEFANRLLSAMRFQFGGHREPGKS